MLFSVITVTWNNLEGIKATHASLLGQDSKNWEWIIIDGNSTDGTKEWLKQLNLSACRWVSEPDSGIFDAMNKGISKAEADYIIFMNAGDEFYADNTLSDIENQIAKQTTKPLFIYGDAIDFTTEGNSFLKKAKSHKLLYKTMFTSHQSMFFNRTFGEKHNVRYPLEYKITGDYAYIALFLKNISNDSAVLKLDFPFCRFLLGGTNEIHRYKALKEDYKIRREIMGMGYVNAKKLYVMHFLHTKIKKNIPVIARILRYKKNV
ncbi:MAG: glycosyltransferase [Bacteroidales bacterium]|nr:glycosyltransferase [Bacteroidales bacterium]